MYSSTTHDAGKPRRAAVARRRTATLCAAAMAMCGLCAGALVALQMRAPATQTGQDASFVHDTAFDPSEWELRLSQAQPAAGDSQDVQAVADVAPAPVASSAVRIERPAISADDPRLAAIARQAAGKQHLVSFNQASSAGAEAWEDRNPFDHHLPDDPTFQVCSTIMACVYDMGVSSKLNMQALYTAAHGKG